jgi:hypothetical protein
VPELWFGAPFNSSSSQYRTMEENEELIWARV